MSDDEAPELRSRALEVVYCPHCSFPPEYCKFGPCWDKCKPWLQQNFPALYEESEGTKGGGGGARAEKKQEEKKSDASLQGKMEDLEVGDSEEDDEGEGDDEEEDKKKKNKRGGKVAGKAPKTEAAPMVRQVVISKSQRNKKKFVTAIKGVETCELSLKKVAQGLAKKFACAASVSGKGADTEIQVQGDITQDLPDYLVSIGIDKSVIFNLNGGVKKKAF